MKKKSQNKNSAVSPERRGLNAKLHIGKKALGMTRDEYEAALNRVTGNRKYWIESATALSDKEVEAVIEYFISLGFRPTRAAKKTGPRRICAALKKRIRAEAAKLENGEARLKGLVRRYKVERLEWLNDPAKLKSLLKTVTEICKKEASCKS
ncbi:regulatory protein GemA [Desulfonema ishimotonii]|uniref:Regulatory protein GemA n=1 Tax=Desulfonema ishimotonii TaxID=45657 RepID=A0A401FZW5_9BACT|nr:phage protein GemA/Gp16 family protein [Desulfonema ishimotonii]GBC62515.1 regulatory protein GemA [Desulfonema ishimotonii]